MRPGYVDNYQRTYFRCEDCGDSKTHTWKAHAFVDKHGKTYCFRCGHKTELSMEQYLSVILNLATIEEVRYDDWVPPECFRNTGTAVRPTLLTRYVAPAPEADSFSMRDRFGNLVGWHTRWQRERKWVVDGDKGICWPGADDAVPLMSRPSDPLTLVEGAYDCISSRHVTTFGSITTDTFRSLRNQHVIVHPDPDVIATVPDCIKFISMLQRANDDFCWIQGVIASDADPDVAKTLDFIPWDRCMNFMREYARN